MFTPDFGDASPCSCVRLLVLFLLFVEDALDVEERLNLLVFFCEEQSLYPLCVTVWQA